MFVCFKDVINRCCFLWLHDQFDRLHTAGECTCTLQGLLRLDPELSVNELTEKDKWRKTVLNQNSTSTLHLNAPRLNVTEANKAPTLVTTIHEISLYELEIQRKRKEKAHNRLMWLRDEA